MSRAMRMGLAALVVAAMAGRATAEPAEGGATHAAAAVTADRALAALREGNARFAAGKPQHPHEARDWRAELESDQHPFAVVLGCSDSRVPPELVFDQGFGDLFVVRVAGNVVDTDVTASIEYAVDHLHAPLVVVLGHTRCGAVTAAIDSLGDVEGEPAEVVELLYRIEPALAGNLKDMPREQQIAQAVRRNVELAVRRLSRVPDLRQDLREGKVKVVGAIFDLHTGRVDFLQ